MWVQGRASPLHPVKADGTTAETPLPSTTVAVALTDHGKAITLASRADGWWRYRELDVSMLMDVKDPVLSSDGTSLRITYRQKDRRPVTLFIDLTRRERKASRHTRESRAIREALEAGDPCRPSDQAPHSSESRRVRSRRCIAFQSATPATPYSRPDRPGYWSYFHVVINPALYLPALQFAPLEYVFPGRTDILSTLNTNADADLDILLDRYLSRPIDHWKSNCVVYYTIFKRPWTWLVEFWFYYPFDVGQQGGHLHDTEHVFVEVDVLGGSVRRVMGAGHGDLAGNNIYDATQTGAAPADLPLLVMVEMGKHATAPDIDRDFVFTPGIDENYYGERAKVWGVRDVIGSNNNHLLAYERTMSTGRRRRDILAGTDVKQHYPAHPDLAEATCSCKLERISWPSKPASIAKKARVACRQKTSRSCAQAKITGNPDYRKPASILKSWHFPPKALRLSYTNGPRSPLHGCGSSA